MNTIQLTEESAIIPLAKLNEYKNMEVLFQNVLRDQEKFIRVHETMDRFDGRQTYYAQTEWTTKYQMENGRRDEINRLNNTITNQGNQLYEQEKEIKFLKESLEKKAKKKFWFW